MIKLKLKSGLLLDMNNFDSEGYIQIKGSSSQMMKYIQMVTYGFEQVLSFLGEIHVIGYMQLSDNKQQTQ